MKQNKNLSMLWKTLDWSWKYEKIAAHRENS